MEGNKLSLNSNFELYNQPYLRSDQFLPIDLHCATYMNNSLATIMSSFSISKVSEKSPLLDLILQIITTLI